MLVVFPLGLLSTAVLFDVLYITTGNRDLSTFSFWALGAGLAGGGGAALFGLIEWVAIPKGTRAKRIGAIHGVGNVAVMGLFAGSFLTRLASSDYLPNMAPFVFGLGGAGVALVTAWLGGELVYRLRVGVDDDANMDASSSFSRDGILEVEGRKT
jgi:uncharacterized membrane protein